MNIDYHDPKAEADGCHMERLRKRLRVKGRAEAFGMVMAEAVAPVAVSSLGAFLKQFVV